MEGSYIRPCYGCEELYDLTLPKCPKCNLENDLKEGAKCSYCHANHDSELCPESSRFHNQETESTESNVSVSADYVRPSRSTTSSRQRSSSHRPTPGQVIKTALNLPVACVKHTVRAVANCPSMIMTAAKKISSSVERMGRVDRSRSYRTRHQRLPSDGISPEESKNENSQGGNGGELDVDDLDIFLGNQTGHHRLGSTFLTGSLATDSPSILNLSQRRDGDLSYEDLIQLEDVKVGLSRLQYRKLPTAKYDCAVHGEENRCQICLEDFVHDESVVTCLCLHRFHEQCGWKWFKDHQKCPICHVVQEV